MLNLLLKKYNQLRKRKYFNSPLFKTKKQYAFIGVGMHSLSNLYPILKHHNIRLKYICTQSSSWKNEFSMMFADTQFVNSIQYILQDEEVEGVFISSSARSHYSLLKEFINCKKQVFIEKPPCFSLDQLKELINISNHSICKVGLQRRYWPGNKAVFRKAPTATSYIYQFHFGVYSGDVLTELFIHALDYCCFVFGEFKIRSFSKHINGSGITVQMHVFHNNGISGLVDLSTQFSWNNPTDVLIVNCREESLTIKYPVLVEGEQKPKRVFNLPAERVLNQIVETKKYFSTTNFIIPSFDVNTLLVQGFYNEIEAFVSLVEGAASEKTFKNDLPSLIPVYEAIEKIRD